LGPVRNASAGPLALVLKLRLQQPPPAIQDGLGHPGLGKFQATDIPNADVLVGVDDPSRKLVQRVAAAPGCFMEMELNRVEAQVHPGNAPSLRVLRRLHFVEECRLRQGGYWAGQYHDLLQYSLLREDWVAEAS
jgi:hypothetical protein